MPKRNESIFYLCLRFPRHDMPPTTSQLSDYGQFVSPIQFVTGNPALKIPRNHFFECSVDFLDMFNIRGSLTVDPDRIGSVVESRVGTRPDGTEGAYVVTMPDNYYLRFWSIDMSFYKSIGNFDINARVNWETDRGRYKDWSMSKSGFSVDASLRYYIPDAGMYAEIEYETPQPYSIDNAMAWSEDTQDYLKIDIGKRFLKGKMNVMVRYLPPSTSCQTASTIFFNFFAGAYLILLRIFLKFIIDS